jgi:hypothetical protein
MASAGKRKTTMAKLSRESRLRERRLDKEARKRARKEAALLPPSQPDDHPSEGEGTVDPAPDESVS